MNRHNITSASRVFVFSKLQLAAVGFFLLTTQISCARVGKDLGIFRVWNYRVESITRNKNPLYNSMRQSSRQPTKQGTMDSRCVNNNITSNNRKADLPANNSYSNSLSGSSCNQTLTEGS